MQNIYPPSYPVSRDSVIPHRAGHNDIRRNNLELVLRHLSTVGPDSRAGIAARAGLTRATVSRLVAELIELGVVLEAGREGGGRAGRPSTRLELGGGVLAIGTEVNVDYLSVLVDRSRRARGPPRPDAVRRQRRPGRVHRCAGRPVPDHAPAADLASRPTGAGPGRPHRRGAGARRCRCRGRRRGAEPALAGRGRGRATPPSTAPRRHADPRRQRCQPRGDRRVPVR